MLADAHISSLGYLWCSLKKQLTFRDATTGFRAK